MSRHSWPLLIECDTLQGFLMVKRAMQEARQVKHGQDDDFLEKDGIGDMAVQNMLGDIMYDGKVKM